MSDFIIGILAGFAIVLLIAYLAKSMGKRKK
jgi:hypothetical protein